MMIKKYRYRVWAGFSVPMMPVAFSYKLNGPFINTMCLVDSGAFMTTLSYDMAQILGVDIKKGIPRTINGVGGSDTAYEHQIYLKIKKTPQKIKVLFYQHLSINIIGRQPVFNQFLIIFNNKRKNLWLIG